MMFALIIVTMVGIARVSRVQEQYNRYIGLYMEIDKSMTRGTDSLGNRFDLIMKKRRNRAEVLWEVSQIEGIHYLEEV